MFEKRHISFLDIVISDCIYYNEIERSDDMSKKSDLGKIAVGAVIGVGLGLLFAPQSGSDTRKILKDKMQELLNKIKNLDSKELKHSFDKKIKEIEKELKELDKEKVLEIAKKKSISIKEKADNLVSLAVETKDEAIEKLTKDVRTKAITVTESVLKKLEETNK